MKRRDLFRAAPAVLLASTMPTEAAVATPIMEMFRQWQQLSAEHERLVAANPTDEETEEEKAVFGRMLELEGRIFAEPATDMADWAHKVCVANGFGEWAFLHETELWAEARNIISERALSRNAMHSN